MENRLNQLDSHQLSAKLIGIIMPEIMEHVQTYVYQKFRRDIEFSDFMKLVENVYLLISDTFLSKSKVEQSFLKMQLNFLYDEYVTEKPNFEEPPESQPIFGKLKE